MLSSPDGDVFHSRSDLHMMIDRSRLKARSYLLQMHSIRKRSILIPVEYMNIVILEEAIVAMLDVDLLEVLVKKFPPTYRSEFAITEINSIAPSEREAILFPHPIHVACNHHIKAIPFLLEQLPSVEADLCGRSPLHLVLLSLSPHHYRYSLSGPSGSNKKSADAREYIQDCEEQDTVFQSVYPLIKHYVKMLDKPFNPSHEPCTSDEKSMLLFLPFHMACTQTESLSIIFEILRSNPASLK